ncbi:RNA polymerase primary sigma factor [Singulisphaera sp. GP187]|uniref:sigma-70 family RNA polymerase sigma factor n=1 Tax=Singulisphaera sp. GP187 TaxID=1882752 RepID=UPI00092BDE4C|nr:sigma-70 family RNA polymerase sigma factor [Singulisphaera sp. GP187]SIO27912.1 RNA polymerase primary sigma factor [Singulisphaera sp. GP187]
MSALSVTTCGPSPFWRASGRGPGPSLSVETSDVTLDRSPTEGGLSAETIRVRRLLGADLSCVVHPSFDDPSAQTAILAPMPAPAVAQLVRRVPVPAGLSPYLASLYSNEAPLLTREQEAHLFRKMNYLKYRASRLRASIDPGRVRAVDLDAFERDLEQALAIRGQIVRANLRLVVSIAKRNLSPQDDLHERFSDGNLVLFQAVETFDYSRGYKFCTYATWAIRNQLMRAYRDKNHRRSHFLLGQDEVLADTADPRSEAVEQADLEQRRLETVTRLLARLGDRERRIIVGRYGIGGAGAQTLSQLGQELGITRERVRQIEARAQAKLRALARPHEIDSLLA